MRHSVTTAGRYGPTNGRWPFVTEIQPRRYVSAIIAIAALVAWFWHIATSFAAPSAGPHRVGILCAIACTTTDVTAFKDALSSRGYREGSDIIFLPRSADGELQRLPQLATELADEKVDVIFTTWGTAAALAAQHATASIPIVVGSAGDLVAAGLAKSLSRPGGNVTGVSSMALDLESKRLEILKELLPAVSRVAVFSDPANPYSALAMQQVRSAADLLQIKLSDIVVREKRDIDKAFAAIAGDRLEALCLHGYAPILAGRDRIIKLASDEHIAVVYPLSDFVRAGGLISYGASLGVNATRAAYYIDRILQGSKAAELPIEQPTTFELVINLNTAKALGLTVPPVLLARADEVID